MALWSLLVAIAVLSGASVLAAPAEDLVPDLPGLSFKPNFKHYSGYLEGATDKKQLHYWFVESSSNPSRDPLVLWFNGGPGCSSLLGMLTEHGPFRINKDAKTVVQNPYAWNQAANMIYLEAPAGVGFSYSTDMNTTTGDNQTALNNYHAIKNFFRKFPEYAGRDFYITGESYGGIYVPTLTYLVMKDSSINLKGFAVGNGLSSYNMNSNSQIYFAYYHGLIDKTSWEALLKDCFCTDTSQCDFATQGSKSWLCENRLDTVSSLVWGGGLNPYNLYQTCAGGAREDLTLYWDKQRHTYVTSTFGWENIFLKEAKEKTQKLMSMHRGSILVAPPCVGDVQVAPYLNSAEVRKALHVPSKVQNWTMCGGVIYNQEYQSMRFAYLAAMEKKLRILVYNGDVDMACNFLGDEWFVDSLHDEAPKKYSRWYYEDEDSTKQIAGFFKQYDHITFVTVKGAGHMVPTDKPKQALEMFVNFIQDKPFNRPGAY